MPRLLRFIIMKAADSSPIFGGTERRESSPPGIFSTLITSAPRSASMKSAGRTGEMVGQVDDLETGERTLGMFRLITKRGSTRQRPLEFRRPLLHEGPDAFLIVLRIEHVET